MSPLPRSTIGLFRRIALALNVSKDMLLFEPDERELDERMKLHFEGVFKLNEKERDAVGTIIMGVLHMHDAKRCVPAHAAPVKDKTEEPKR